jgi:nucleoside-diphosphate-sugar epimerase
MADAAGAVRVVITGGAGFLGALLARRLLTSPLTLRGGQAAQVGELLLVDLVAPPAEPRRRQPGPARGG